MSSKEARKARPLVGVGVMILRNDKVLLGRRQGAHGASTYGWCGGHLEFGESLEECAAREVCEETGLVVKSLQLICLSNLRSYDKHYIDVEFKAEVGDGEPQVLEPDKVESWNWYSFDNLPTPLFTAVQLAIKSYQTGCMYNP